MTAALAILRAGGVVGMPTETVYGLAADARDAAAVARVFALKGRPATNPLIVHVASVEVAARYAVVDERARALFAAFAPGPLTLVLPVRTPGRTADGPALIGDAIASVVTAGLHTVGIRIPDHPVALELLRAFDGPLAAPSANRSNHVSPTTAEHVREAFGDAVPVLDGGPCRVGIESTVLSLAGDVPTILRPGSVSRAAIEAIVGPVDAFAGHLATDVAHASPGQSVKHYAPRAPAWRADRETIERLVRSVDPFGPHTPTAVRSDRASIDNPRADARPDPTAQRSAWVNGSTRSIAYITFGDLSDAFVAHLGTDPEVAARRFYAELRVADAGAPVAIFIELPPDGPAWSALRDRIARATRPWVE